MIISTDTHKVTNAPNMATVSLRELGSGVTAECYSLAERWLR